MIAVKLWRKISSLWQPPVFDGEIGRMVAVAAPAGAGKSTFLDHLTSSRGPTVLPGHLSYASAIAGSYLHLFQLYRQRARRIEEIAIHIDLLGPVLTGLDTPYDLQQIIENMEPGLYRNYRFLARCFGKTKQLDIVILYVRRPTNLHRWLERESQSKKPSARYDCVTTILGDSSDNSELHRAMYRAWLQFCESLNPRSITIVDANDDDAYALMPVEDFRRQLDEGY